jgi:hypothetical protein
MARQFVWTPGDGSTPVTLTDKAAGYSVKAAGTRGLSSPAYRMTSTTYAGQSGATLQALEADVREVALGVQVEAGTVADYRQRWRRLVRAFRPKAGDGTLTVTDEWGAVRTFTGRYAGGLEGDGEAEFTGTIGRAVVRLAGFDPWFYGLAQTIDFGLAAPTAFFPIFPVRLSPSTIQGQFVVDLSDADDLTYPTWTITGPGSALTLTNVTTGRTIQVNAALGDGQTMTIDTRPGFQSVTRGDGANLMGALTTDPALWPLADDVNTVSALLTNAGPASRIVGTYRPRYAGI